MVSARPAGGANLTPWHRSGYSIYLVLARRTCATRFQRRKISTLHPRTAAFALASSPCVAATPTTRPTCPHVSTRHNRTAKRSTGTNR
jgi:hypothetical protein